MNFDPLKGSIHFSCVFSPRNWSFLCLRFFEFWILMICPNNSMRTATSKPPHVKIGQLEFSRSGIDRIIDRAVRSSCDSSGLLLLGVIVSSRLFPCCNGAFLELLAPIFTIFSTMNLPSLLQTFNYSNTWFWSMSYPRVFDCLGTIHEFVIFSPY